MHRQTCCLPETPFDCRWDGKLGTGHGAPDTGKLTHFNTLFWYTGQREEASFGLYYYGARWYDPALGRFVQADTIVPGGVQGLDRYAYVNNNPLKYTDPSGHDVGCTGYDAGTCGGNNSISGNLRMTNLQSYDDITIYNIRREDKNWNELSSSEKIALSRINVDQNIFDEFKKNSNAIDVSWSLKEDPFNQIYWTVVTLISVGQLAPVISYYGPNATKNILTNLIRQLILQFPNYAPRISEQTDIFHDFPRLLDPLIIQYGDLIIKSSNYLQFNSQGFINDSSGVFEIGVQYALFTWKITHHFFNPNPNP